MARSCVFRWFFNVPKKVLISTEEREEPACPCVKHTSSTRGCALTFADARPDRRSKRWAELLPRCSSEIPLDGAAKKKTQTSPSDVKCPLRASPGQELCARLRSQKGGICHLAEVMTHAAVLLHLHRPSPRKCRRGGAPGAAWVAGRKKPARPWGARQPRAHCGGRHSWLRLRGAAAGRGGTSWRLSLLRASALRSFVCVR